MRGEKSTVECRFDEKGKELRELLLAALRQFAEGEKARESGEKRA